MRVRSFAEFEKSACNQKAEPMNVPSSTAERHVAGEDRPRCHAHPDRVAVFIGRESDGSALDNGVLRVSQCEECASKRPEV